MGDLDPRRIEEALAIVLHPDTDDGPENCSEALYRYASGQATPAQTAAFEEHLQRHDACRQDLETFRRWSAVMEADVPRSTRRWPVRPVFAAAGLALAASVVVAIVPRQRQAQSDGQELRPKSGYRLHLAVQRGPSTFVAGPDDRFVAGDTIGLFYTAPTDTWIAVLHADDKGQATVLHPLSAAKQSPAGTRERLAAGARVEAGEGCEWIVGFFSPEPLALAELSAALGRAAGRRGDACELRVEVPGVYADTWLIREP